MRAAVCRTFGEPLSIEELAIAAPEAGEVRVRLSACAICHSDIMFADGAWGGDLPAVFGHEASGIIDAVGEGVNEVVAGDHVVVTLIRSCGQCGYCARSIETQCEGAFRLAGQSPLSDGSNKAARNETSGIKYFYDIVCLKPCLFISKIFCVSQILKV